MTTFHLSEPFDIDDGSLSEMTPEQAFVLGYELSMAHFVLQGLPGGKMMVHTDNRRRIDLAAQRRGREIKWHQSHDDWCTLEVVR